MCTGPPYQFVFMVHNTYIIKWSFSCFLLCRHKFLFSKVRIKFACVTCWVFSVLLLGTLIYSPIHSELTDNNKVCVPSDILSLMVRQGLTIYQAVIMLSVVVIYVRMFYLLKRQAQVMASVTHGANHLDVASQNVTKLAVFVIGMRLCHMIFYGPRSREMMHLVAFVRLSIHPLPLSPLKSNNHHYQSKVIVCVS